MSSASEAALTPLSGIDLVEGVGRLWAGTDRETVFALRPSTPYASWGAGRLVLAAAFALAVAAGELDGSERVTLDRPKDWGDRGVLSTLGSGVNPTWRDLMTFALELEDTEAAARLGDRLGRAALNAAAQRLGLDPAALAVYPESAPEVTARDAAAAFLALPGVVGEAGMALLLPMFRGSRYRWRVRTRLEEDWEMATAGSKSRRAVEEIVLWQRADGWAAAALAFTDADDAWRAEYALGDAFRRVVEGVGAPSRPVEEGAER